MTSTSTRTYSPLHRPFGYPLGAGLPITPRSPHPYLAALATLALVHKAKSAGEIVALRTWIA